MAKKKTSMPLFQPDITDADKKSILASLGSPIISDGPKLREFESKFAKFMKTKYAVGVSSATAALHLSLTSLGIGKGDEVIVPDYTFVATANAVALTNAKPICADIDSSLNISIDSLKQNITKKTKGIIVVHFAGQPCQINRIQKIAKEYDLKIIEDCAHAVGSRYNKKYVGTFGDAGCFSFFATKNMTTIEGGMIITNSKQLAEKSRALRAHGITKSVGLRHKTTKPWDYDVPFPGYNYKLDEIRSSLGLSQLKRMKEIISKRRKAAKYYDTKLKGVKGIEVVNQKNNKNHVYHLYIIRIKKEFGKSRDKVHLKLKEKGIQTTVHYKPIHRFSQFYQDKLNDSKFPNSVSAYKECLSLPMFTTISKKQQDYVIKELRMLRR